jgi:1,4-alpha-glucan branching enzyme
MRPLNAIAAGLICAMVGAAAAATLMRYSGSGSPDVASPVATQTAAGRTPVRFTLQAPDAGKVFLVGDFNGWNPAAIPLRRSADGTWEVEVPLPPGRYAYSFMVDGALATDPSAPQARDDDFGSVNSVVMVKGS